MRRTSPSATPGTDPPERGNSSIKRRVLPASAANQSATRWSRSRYHVVALRRSTSAGTDNLQRLQRSSTSFSRRSRTIRQSVVSSSPARAAATLPRISLAQAASTSSSASFRLSSNPAAIFARSSSGNSNACFRRSRASRGMTLDRNTREVFQRQAASRTNPGRSHPWARGG